MYKILLTKEVADMLRVSEEYVRELIRERRIKAYREGRRGGFRIESTEVDNYIKEKYDLFAKRKYKGRSKRRERKKNET